MSTWQFRITRARKIYGDEGPFTLERQRPGSGMSSGWPEMTLEDLLELKNTVQEALAQIDGGSL